jgi:hypothetical protein
MFGFSLSYLEAVQNLKEGILYNHASHLNQD